MGSRVLLMSRAFVRGRLSVEVFYRWLVLACDPIKWLDAQPEGVRSLVNGAKLRIYEWQNGDWSLDELRAKVAEVAAECGRATKS